MLFFYSFIFFGQIFLNNFNPFVFLDDDSDNTPSEIQTDPESPSLDHSIPSDPHSTPSTSPSPTVPGTPATVPHMTLEEKLKHFQQNLTAVNEERETLLASLKSIRKESQKADSALRSEIDTLKRNSERHALAESKGRQKILALQEAVRRAQNATKEIEAKLKELEAEMPDLNKAKDEKENEYETLKKEAEKVRKEREVLEEKEKKRQEAMKADLAGLTVKLEKLGAKKEKLETGIVPELEQKLKEIEKEIEDEEQNLLKWNANAQNLYHHHQQRQQQQQQRSYHTHNHSEDYHPTASSVPIQRPRYHSSEFPTPIGRPTPAPIQRPTQSDLTSSNLGYSTATSTIWAQRPIQQQQQQQQQQQPQSHSSHHSQIPQRPPPTSQQTLPAVYSPRLHQLNNPRSLSFHNSMVAPTSATGNSSLIRRSSLKNSVSVPFSPSFNATTTSTTTSSGSSGSSGSNTPGSSSFKSVTSSPTRSHASMVASSSTLSSKAPAFEPTGSISVISKLTGGGGGGGSIGIIPNANVTPKSNPNSSTSPVMSKGKEAVLVSTRASTVPTPLPAPIQRPVARASSGGDSGSGSGSGNGSGSGRRRHSQWNYSGGF